MPKRIFLPLAALLLFNAFVPSPACAGGTFNILINGKSYHFNSSYDWNEDNIGLGFEYEFEQKSAWKKVTMVNGFRDSTDNMSYMAGAGLHRRVYDTDKLAGFSIYAGLNAFMMTRDDFNSGRPFPGILPSITIGNQRVGLNLTYLPRKLVKETLNRDIVDPTLSGILFVQIKGSLGR
jgi:hypothetical protein